MRDAGSSLLRCSYCDGGGSIPCHSYTSPLFSLKCRFPLCRGFARSRTPPEFFAEAPSVRKINSIFTEVSLL